MNDTQHSHPHVRKAPNLAPVIIGCLTAGIAIGLGIGFTVSKARNSNAGGAGSSMTGANGNLFELDGKAYSAQEFPGEARDFVYQVQSQAYESLADFTKQLALRVSLASEGGKKVDTKTLPPLRELLGLKTLPEEEMKKFFEANAKGLPPGTKYEDIKPQIEQFLINQKSSENARTKIGELEASNRMKILIKPPEARIVDLKTAEFPTKGAATAAVTLVEAADYLCPHCREMEETINEALKENEGKVKFVYVSYPLRPAGLNGYLAKGTFCANKQSPDKVWAYREKAYQVPLSAQGTTGPTAAAEFEKLTMGVAKDAGLELAAFEACVKSPEAQMFIDKTVQDMTGAGVTGTPTFFINNKKVTLTSPATLKEQLKLAVAHPEQK